jgi:hypothetical protein
MNDTLNETGGAGPSHRSAEIGVAAVIAFFGLVAIYGSLKVGAGWGSDGPQAGFFPFYIGVVILIACAVNLYHVLAQPRDGAVFASWPQLRQVSAVVVPTAIYVLVIPYTGIYVASAVLIAAFMIWLGRYPWTVAVAVGIGMPVLTFVMFEIWFLVPLPKGPLERLLGF